MPRFLHRLCPAVNIALNNIVLNVVLTMALSTLITQQAFSQDDAAKPAAQHSAVSIKKAKSPAPEAASPELVRVGIYLNDVQNIDVHANNYLMDFYVWFKWKNKEIDPSTSFEFMNHSESWGTMMNKPTETPETLPDGSLYQVVHVQGRMSEKMDLRAYPFDHQNLVILLEDNASDLSGLVYEIEEVTVNPALKIPGFEFHKPELKAAAYTYPTRFGDTRMQAAGNYARITFKLPVYRNAITSFVKNILPIWLAVICAIFSLMLHPRLIDSRFQIAIFSILSLVALQICNGNDLPALQYMNLMDALYVVAYIYLILLMAELIIATKWIESEHPADHERAKRLDSRFGYVCTTLFFLVNFYLIFVTFA